MSWVSSPSVNSVHLLHPASDRLGLTTVLKAFLDGSEPFGTANVAVVAGFVAPGARWELFESKWTPLLQELKLSRWHMTDYRRRKKAYDRWSADQFIYAKDRVIEVLNSCFFDWGRLCR